MSTGKILLGVLAGVAVGATLGILFAPDKGSATRKKISDKGGEYADEIGDKFHKFVDGVSKKFDSAKESVNEMAENGKYKAQEAGSHLASTANRKM
ncbi:MAG: YtxH domain-containing protein [Flavobacteriales bacterium]|nr:YtxH domain-containing protein [Flavobacteriales bacterium]